MSFLLFLACAPDGVAFPHPAPDLVADTDAVAFPLTARGDTSSVALNVTNRGEALDRATVHLAPPFSADRAALTLGAGGTASLTLSFHPADYLPTEGTLTLGTLVVALSGSVNLDGDGDGADAAEAGGSDCDDTDAAVFPGATDPCYDGVDGDCAQDDDDDCDGDGYALSEDCEDDDDAIHPAANETENGRDDDCDGLADEDLLVRGALFLAELHPSGSPWVELCSGASGTLSLAGLDLVTNGGTTRLDTGDLDAGACASVCDNVNSGCTYTAPLTLSEQDVVRIQAGATVVDAVAMTAAWAPVGTATWSLEPGEGASGNNSPEAWCVTEGSPGSPNPACR